MRTEEEILYQCQNGNLQDFGELYERYIKKIHDFVYFKTLHRETAEDLTAKTFHKALENIRSVDPQKHSFSAWLYAIARNSVIDHYRTTKNTVDIEDAYDLSSKEDIEIAVDAKLKMEKVQKALEKLTPEQREIIILKLWQDLPYEEIAKIVRKSPENCRIILSRGLKKIRQEKILAIFLLLLLT